MKQLFVGLFYQVGNLCLAAAAGTGWVPGPVMPKVLGSPEQAARRISKPRARIVRMQKLVLFPTQSVHGLVLGLSVKMP
jgi:hypothetical protein